MKYFKIKCNEPTLHSIHFNTEKNKMCMPLKKHKRVTQGRLQDFSQGGGQDF